MIGSGDHTVTGDGPTAYSVDIQLKRLTAPSGYLIKHELMIGLESNQTNGYTTWGVSFVLGNIPIP